ncbi:replication protein RepA (plasmid) [Nocardia sp. CA-084685]|uniref:replication protein RepA n=1 Tax=Nocardia sp. CA-084685 TaxID=3239970 RepID=UPI003D962BD7
MPRPNRDGAELAARAVGRPKRDEVELAALALRVQEQRAQELQDVGYLGRLFTQFSLPYKDPGDDKTAWGRESGNYRITVQPGMVVENGVPHSYGFPFGGIPRLVLAHLSTEAVLRGEPVIELGHSQSEFMRTVGLGRATGGKSGTIGRFQNQTERLLRSNITIDFKDRYAKERSTAIKLSIADNWDLWWITDPDGSRRPVRRRKGDDQLSLLDNKASTITLSAKFFEEVMAHPVPVDMKVLNLLQSSPMAMDIYIWLTYRMFNLKDPVLISWPLLMLQFGTNLADTKQGRHQFRRDFKKHLQTIKPFYPDLRVEVIERAEGNDGNDRDEKTGLLLYPSPTHVVQKPPRRLRAIS